MIKLLLIMSLFTAMFDEKVEINHNYLDNQIEISINNIEKENKEYIEYKKKEEEKYIKEHSFNGELDTTIINKINRYLNSTMKNKGKFIVDYSLKVGIDPYLSTAVMLQESGCAWTCSYLTRVCNNVAGNKGDPGCDGGSYRKFDTIEEGIKFAINKLNSYYQKGLTTPEEINPYYAEDKTWYKKVNNYITKLKS